MALVAVALRHQLRMQQMGSFHHLMALATSRTQHLTTSPMSRPRLLRALATVRSSEVGGVRTVTAEVVRTLRAGPRSKHA